MAGCSSCGTGGEKTTGCNSNGGCSTGGCNKMNVFDWLSNMDMPTENKSDVVEVRFKNGHKGFYKKTEEELITGDAVIVDVPNGHHMGHVSMQGELVRLQMQKKRYNEKKEPLRKIYRKASLRDIEKYDDVKKRENPTLFRARQIINDLELQMKLSDVEYQADNTKAIFYYSAEDRVDFRELIKLLAGEFRIRVEMKQISLRQEASRLGGIGSCGRELCCSTWLSEFKSVSTSAARYQNLSLNPSKLSGQCGRLKCCLNYELQTYMDALSDIPKVEAPLKIAKGKAYLQKTDIFKKTMWFGYQGENAWHPIPVARVNEIIALNKEGKEPVTLLEDDFEIKDDSSKALNNDLARMDKKYSSKGGGSKPKKKRKPFRKGKANFSNKKKSE
jgi:cell fate regulator YaaT (PSP1 superfamily)